MNYKVESAIKKNRKTFVIFFVMLIILALFLVPGFTGAYVEAINQGGEDIFYIFIDNIANYVYNPIVSFGAIFKYNYFTTYFTNLIVSSVVLLLFFLIGIFKSAPKHEYTDIEHGSADWSTNGEQYKILNKKSGIRLAQNNFLPLNKKGNLNVLVVGRSGSGKSASFSIPNAYQMLGSYIFTDPKGELYDQTAGYLKEHGYKIKVLNLVNPALSDGYNPLAHISNDIDVDIISQTIVKGQSESNADPYWEDNAQMLLKALIYFLKAARPPEEQNLASCAELVRAASANGDSSMLANLINQFPTNHPARTNFKSVELASDKAYGSILSTLQSKLGKFDSKEIAALTSTDTIDFEQIGSEKTAVYVISPDTHSAYDFLLTIFFSQMIQQLYDFADKNGGGLKEKVFFILDEFANIGQIPDFDKKISTSRSRNISFSVILQNVDQLEAVYEKSYETIMGNCDTHLFLGSNSTKTLEYFSKALGEKTIERDSVSIQKDKASKLTGKSYSDSASARALMTPDELRRMSVDDCIIFVKGIRPVKARKFYWFENKDIAKNLNTNKISHNDLGDLNRGEWRIFDPRNPYEDKKEQIKNLDLQQLDDLLDVSPNTSTSSKPKTSSVDLGDLTNLDNLFDDNVEGKKEENKETNNEVNDFYDVPNKGIYKDEEDKLDLETEIEKLYDQLFNT